MYLLILVFAKTDLGGNAGVTSQIVGKYYTLDECRKAGRQAQENTNDIYTSFTCVPLPRNVGNDTIF